MEILLIYKPWLRVPYVSTHMSRDRFDVILSNLLINDNSLIPHNKLYKVRPMVNELNNYFCRNKTTAIKKTKQNVVKSYELIEIMY